MAKQLGEAEDERAHLDLPPSSAAEHSADPIIAITFERRKRSALVNHAVVKVKVLSRCDETRAGGRFFYFRRLKNEWRLDRKRYGRWASVTDVVY